MFFSELKLTPVSNERAGDQGTGAAVSLIGSVVGHGNRYHSLMAWNRNPGRPACCAHLPSRVWCRDGALMTLRTRGWLR